MNNLSRRMIFTITGSYWVVHWNTIGSDWTPPPLRLTVTSSDSVDLDEWFSRQIPCNFYKRLVQRHGFSSTSRYDFGSSWMEVRDCQTWIVGERFLFPRTDWTDETNPQLRWIEEQVFSRRRLIAIGIASSVRIIDDKFLIDGEQLQSLTFEPGSDRARSIAMHSQGPRFRPDNLWNGDAPCFTWFLHRFG
jgi:hypothetical protein